jgi:peptidoglycan/LPS O-acetylase OafA/YrhL
MGLAIIAVILHHLCYRLDVAWHLDTFPFTPFIHGNLGVDLFFFASAYGCSASWEHNNWFQYYVNRIRRIFPQYILFLIIVLSYFYPGTSLFHNVKVVLLSLTGLAPINLFHTRIEWFIPSLLLVYFTLPLLKMILNVKERWQITIMVLGLILSQTLLKYDLLYWTFQTRIPVIMCGVFAYLNRERKGYCIKVFSLMLIIAFCMREEMIIYSMIVPLLMVSLSFVNLSNVPAKSLFSWFGKHSLEIFFAQTITTQFIMHRYYWGNKLLSLSIIVGLTIVLSFVFWGWYLLFRKIENKFVLSC